MTSRRVDEARRAVLPAPPEPTADRATAGGLSTPASVLELQRSAGNAAVSRMLSSAVLQRNGPEVKTPAPAGPYTGYSPAGGSSPPPKAKSPEEVLREVADAITEIGGTATAADKQVVCAEVIKIPIIALTALKKKGVKIVVCRNSVTEIRTDLKGVRPRGWPEGKSWDTVPGLNDPSNNRVIIATRGGKVPPTGDGHGAANLVLHEVGHAIGDAVTVGGVSDPAFIKARDADKAKLDTYEGQAGAPGVRETYAESFARFYSGDPDDAKNYPNLHAYWAGNPFVSKSP